MLDAYSHIVFLCGPHVSLAHGDDLLGILSVGADVHDGVAPVEVKVADGREGPVAARSGGLLRGDHAHAVGLLRVAGRADAQLLGEEGAVLQEAGGAKFEVRCAEHGYLAALLHEVQRRAYLLGGAGLEQQAAHVETQQLILQIAGVGGIADGAEQLAHLLFQRHGSEGIFHPRDLLIVQIKGLGFQVHARDTPFFSTFPMTLSMVRPWALTTLITRMNVPMQMLEMAVPSVLANTALSA